jgi:hypothetical protein
VKTTISDLGYDDFSEWFIGHSGYTYWTKKDSEKAEIFCKIEPYLTFLNIPQLERQSADIQSKVEELELLNQSPRSRDKLKDDAISHWRPITKLLQVPICTMVSSIRKVDTLLLW